MKLKTLVPVLTGLILVLSLVQSGCAQSSSDMQMFYSKCYVGISLRVDATRELTPDRNMTVELWINCTSDDVHLDYFNFSIYGFINGTGKTFLAVESIMNNVSLTYNSTTEHSLTVNVPVEVWDTTFVELLFRYAIVDWSSPDYDVSFAVTYVGNAYLESVTGDLSNLTRRYHDLNSSYWDLNKTYNELQKNYTALEGSANELDNTRRAAVILVVTTVFFVATTLYLVLRKPKDYW